MIKGLKIGDSVKISAEVTKEMFAQFAGEVVHPTYSTVSMVYHMEWASRNLLIPYLEDGEEGMGAAVKVKHITPSGLGTKIEITAAVSKVSEWELVTDVYVKNEYGVIGKGEVIQKILPKKMIEEKLKQQSASR
ncbi:thioesterase family protein [Virgibacillus oceani]